MQVFIATDTSIASLSVNKNTRDLAAFESARSIVKNLKKQEREHRNRQRKSRKIDEEFLERIKAGHEAAMDRIQNGFDAKFPHFFDNKHHDPVQEQGLRSDAHPILRLFPYYTARNKDLRVGNEKHELFKTDSKLSALDYRYIRLNMKFIGGFRIDIDSTFNSIGDLKSCISHADVPMPHVVVSQISVDGKISKPHLWYLLHPNDAVWADRTDKRVRRKPLKLLYAIQRAITDALVPFGADPGGSQNPFHGKNPLSPWWQTHVTNDEFLDLKGYEDQLHIVPAESLEVRCRKAAQIASGLDMDESNRIFNNSRKAAFTSIFNLKKQSPSEYNELLNNRDTLTLHIRNDLISTLNITETKHLKVIDRVASYAANEWNHDKSEPRSRGAMLHEIKPEMTIAERQSASAIRSAAIKKASSLETLRAAHARLLDVGITPSINTLSRESGLSPRTVTRLRPSL